MKKVFIRSITLLLFCLSNHAYAALASNATLLFDPVVYGGCPVGGTPPNCDFGLDPNITGGSFFWMGNSTIMGDGDRVGVVAKDGIKIGQFQSASSTVFLPDGIDQPFVTSQTISGGAHATNNIGNSLSGASPVTIFSDDNAGNVLLDMSGWGIVWNEVPFITLGSGSWGGNPEGKAVLSCVNDCSFGDTFSLFYTAKVPDGDPSGFGGTYYRLGLENSNVFSGKIGSYAVPIPAAIWLFGSGLLALVVVSRGNQTGTDVIA